MVYLFTTLANDAEFMPSLLHAVARSHPLSDEPEMWGVGYYADGRALIISKPGSIVREPSAFEVAQGVKSRIVMACAGSAEAQGGLPPYRFRDTLFAHSGQLDGLTHLKDTLLGRLPPFVRSALVSDQPGALAFGMFLADMHRANLLDSPLNDPEDVARVLAGTSDTIKRLTAETEAGPAAASLVASQGRAVIAVQNGAPLAWRWQEGLERLPEGPPDPALNDFKRLAAALKRFRALMLKAGPPEAGWQVLEPGTTLVVDGHLEVHFHQNDQGLSGSSNDG